MFTTVLAIGPHTREIYKMPHPHTTPHDEEFMFLNVYFTAPSHMHPSQQLKSEHKECPQDRKALTLIMWWFMGTLANQRPALQIQIVHFIHPILPFLFLNHPVRLYNITKYRKIVSCFPSHTTNNSSPVN